MSKYSYFGGYIGDGNFSFLISYDGNISSAEIEAVVNKDFDVYVNQVLAGHFIGSTSEFTPVNYSISVNNFVSGDNNVEIRGDNLHIAGGFLRIRYRPEAEFQQYSRYYFPGVKGLINVYDGFYVPGNLTSMSVSLHINSSASFFLNFGNVTVFNGTTNGEQLYNLSNSNLSSILNYNSLSRKTTPLRLGLENVSYTSTADVDAISATDISNSMDSKCQGENLFCCRRLDCDHNKTQCTGCGGTFEDKFSEAKNATKLFVDLILNYSSDNRVGLTPYSKKAENADFHQLSNNKTSLNNKINSWTLGSRTCICCGINKAVDEFIANSNNNKFRAIVVMSDGQANEECVRQNTGNPDEDAIQAACTAYEDYNITVYSVGFGTSADEETMQGIATCGGGAYYYSDIDELADVFRTIVDDIFTEYFEQTINSTGDIKTQLFSDSYIDFGYQRPSLQGLIITLEKAFSNSSGGIFSVPSGSQVIEALVTSYSGPRWTERVSLDNTEVYNLNNYGSNYIALGDPYIVSIDNSLINSSNNYTVSLTTSNGQNSSDGSIYNKIIYTFSKDVSAFSPIVISARGCNWQIEFDSGKNASMTIPESFSGGDQCFYTSALVNIFNDNDAYQLAVLSLLRNIDLDSNGKVDFSFEERDLAISLEEVTGIPFTWSTEVQVRRWF